MMVKEIFTVEFSDEYEGIIEDVFDPKNVCPILRCPIERGHSRPCGVPPLPVKYKINVKNSLPDFCRTNTCEFLINEKVALAITENGLTGLFIVEEINLAYKNKKWGTPPKYFKVLPHLLAKIGDEYIKKQVSCEGCGGFTSFWGYETVTELLTAVDTPSQDVFSIYPYVNQMLCSEKFARVMTELNATGVKFVAPVAAKVLYRKDYPGINNAPLEMWGYPANIADDLRAKLAL